MKYRNRALLKAYRNELGIRDEVTKSDVDSLVAQIQEGAVLTEREVGTVIIIYTNEDYLYRSDAEKEIVSALRDIGAKVIIKLVEAGTPVRKYMPWPFSNVPKPDYWDDTVIAGRRT